MVKRLLVNVALLLASVATLAGVAIIIRVAFDSGEEATLTFAPTAVSKVVEDEGEEHLEEIISRGRELYLSVGCAACHGQNAEGSSIGPALPGHTEEQVKSQVRNPIKNMPAFSQAQIDDEGLDAIAAYITSLEVDVAHVEPLEMEDLVAVHHWMAILALKNDNIVEAQHHVVHIIELVTDPEHRHQMEEVLEMLEAGELHGAEHTIEGMLAGTAEPGLTLEQLHLRLADSAIQGRDVEDALHHIEHFLETATGTDRTTGEEIIGLLEAGDLHEAGDIVEELLGIEHDEG